MSETHVREAAVGESDAGGAPELSVVVTLFQEGATLEELQQRLTTTLTAFGRSYEVLYVDDGSTDGTFASLERIHDGDSHVRACCPSRSAGIALYTHRRALLPPRPMAGHAALDRRMVVRIHRGQ